MSDEKKDKDPRHPARPDNLERNVRGHPARSTDPERDERGFPETNFLPPLKMFLAFFDKESRQKKKKGAKQEDPDEKNVERLIEKLSESEEENRKK
jgi:hypothetical protein